LRRDAARKRFEVLFLEKPSINSGNYVGVQPKQGTATFGKFPWQLG